MEELSRKTAIAVGNTIKELRQTENLSQEKLAELADLHRNAIGFIERGERTPSIHTLHIIAKGLGTTASQILDKAGY